MVYTRRLWRSTESRSSLTSAAETFCRSGSIDSSCCLYCFLVWSNVSSNVASCFLTLSTTDDWVWTFLLALSTSWIHQNEFFNAERQTFTTEYTFSHWAATLSAKWSHWRTPFRLVCEQLLKTWRELFDIATPLLVGILKLIHKGAAAMRHGYQYCSNFFNRKWTYAAWIKESNTTHVQHSRIYKKAVYLWQDIHSP